MPFNSKPGARKYGDNPMKSGFKMRSGNGPLTFKEMGGSPTPKLDGFGKAFATAHAEQGPGGKFDYKGKSYSTDRADGKNMQKTRKQIEPTKIEMKKVTMPEVSETKPIEPMAMSDIPETKTKEAVKSEKKKGFDSADFSKRLGALSDQIKGKKSMHTSLAETYQKEADAKKGDKAFDLAERKQSYLEDKFKADQSHQDLLSENLRLKIANTKASSEMKTDAVDSLSGKDIGVYTDKA